MATGVNKSSKMFSEPRGRSRGRSAWQRSSSTSDKDDAVSMNSNSQEVRPNNWDFSDWRPNATFDSSKRRKKGNAERDREKALKEEIVTTPQSDKKQRTPSTFPRTKITSGTPLAQRVSLQNLRQHMTFCDQDEVLTNADGGRNNSRNVASHLDRLPNLMERPEISRANDGAARMTSSNARRERKSPRNESNNRDDNATRPEGPESNRIVGRLMQIRDYIKQAHTMMNTLQKPGSPQENKEDLIRLRRLAENLREQEKGYMSLLQQMLATREDGVDAIPGIFEIPKLDGMDDTASLDMDIQSEVSEATTECTLSSSCRPRIEDKLGVCTDEEDIEKDDLQSETSSISEAVDNTVLHASGGHGPDWDYESDDVAYERNDEMAALRQQQDLLQKMLQQKEQLRALQGRQATLLALQKDAEQRLAEERTQENQPSVAAASVVSASVAAASEGASPSVPSAVLQMLSEQGGAEANAMPEELLELRQRLDYLKNLFDLKTENLSDEDPYAAEDKEPPLATMGRRQLQDKLHDLQDKKAKMDDLLGELESLRTNRFVDHAKNETPVEGPASTKLASSHQAVSGAAKTEDEAQDLLNMIDAKSKLRTVRDKKLNEVRDRLDQLKSLVHQYQLLHGSEPPGHEGVLANIERTLQGQLTNEDRDMEATVGNREIEARLLPNIRTLPSSQTPDQENIPPEINQDEESEEDNMSDSEATESLDSKSSIGTWGDDPEIQEKIKSLKAAKENLRTLQNFVDLVQRSPDGEVSIPDFMVPPPVISRELERHSNTLSETANAEPRYLSVYNKMQEHLKELERLKTEKEKVLTLQDQLQSMHQRFPEIENEEDNKEGIKMIEESQHRPEPNQGPVVTFSNDEVYDRMRRQRILHEELRQKKRELEAIMRKDRPRRQYFRNQDNQSDTVSYSTEAFGASVMSADATMATWGGSTVDNLESITEDEDGGGDRNDDNDYPSDGIVQVEEEEEENDEFDSQTYTIENDVRQQQATGRRMNQRSGRMDNGLTRRRKNAARPQSAIKQNSKISWQTLDRQNKQPRQENFRTAEDLMNEDEQNQPNLSASSQRQMERSQLLLRDQTAVRNIFTGSTPAAGPSSPFLSPYLPDQFQQQQQLQQQQVLLSVNQCQHQLSLQQQDMHRLQQQLQNLTLRMGESRDVISYQNSTPLYEATSTPPYAVIRHDRNSTTSRMDNSSQTFKLNPVFDDEIAEERENDAYNMAKRNMMASNNARPPKRKMNDSEEVTRASAPINALYHNDIYNLLSEESEALYPGEGTDVFRFQGTRNSKKPSRGQSSTLSPRQNKRTPVHENIIVESSNRVGMNDGTIPKLKFNRPSREVVTENIVPQRYNRQGENDATVPPLNLEELLNAKRKRTQGEKSREEKSESAVIGRKYPTPSRASAGARLASQQTRSDYRPGVSAGISGSGYPDMNSQSSGPSSINEPEVKKLSAGMFEVLRENIYSEVAALISQNEEHPHFLIELFGSLQLLTSDYLRQRALYAIQQIMSSFLTEDAHSSPAGPWYQSTDKYQQASSELTPSESLATSEEEDMRARSKEHRSLPAKPSSKSLLRTGSLQNDEFDYAERADNTSTYSTPSTSFDSPFAQDSLGETVIHFDKALQHIRDYEAQVEQVLKNSSPMAQQAEAAENAFQDQTSESSISDVPNIPDTEQVDLLVTTIVKEVIPILKEERENVCSSQLLEYIKRLVLSLARQRDTGSEFSRACHSQLAIVLQDCLAKFRGKKMRDVADELLQDVSDLLFKELAIFNLMQRLNDPGVDIEMTTSKQSPRSAVTKRKTAVKSSVEATSVMVNVESTSGTVSSSASSTVPSDSEADESLDTAMKITAREVEDLGKARDDEMAYGIDPNADMAAVQIELAVSEQKPFTRIGSDEDDDDADESQSLEDPSETAVSRDAEKEKSFAMEVKDGDATPKREASGAMPIISMPGDNDSTVTESQGNDDGIVVNGPVLGDEPQVNGEVAGSGQGDLEVNVDDLPLSLTVMSQDELVSKMSDEQTEASGVAGILTTMETEAGQLAGDDNALKDPEPSC